MFHVFSQGSITRRLGPVIYGDVWFCSGQSNMKLEMRKISNSSLEIHKSRRYNNIFMLQVPSPKPTQEVRHIYTYLIWEKIPTEATEAGFLKK